ncbi:MAG: hypothetical protein GXY67_04060 [Clostridiales bacterium]|nr:hypothetical protein [Clostridiales bacterium]
MLQKILSLLIALTLLFSATALAATEKYTLEEDFQQFDVEVEIPEGAQYKQNPKDGWLSLEIWFEDPAKPSFDLNISFSEEVEGGFLADFSQEDKDHLVALISEDFSVPVHEFFETPSGNTVLLTRETDTEAGDYALMVTVYKGFFFSLYCSHQDYSPLAEEDLALMHQIIEGTWITDTEK